MFTDTITDTLIVAGMGAALVAAPYILAGPDADQAEVDCPTCHGCGVIDIDDHDGRPILFDVDCLQCRGTGRIEAA